LTKSNLHSNGPIYEMTFYTPCSIELWAMTSYFT
jgi:hypothetical protein